MLEAAIARVVLPGQDCTVAELDAAARTRGDELAARRAWHAGLRRIAGCPGPPPPPGPRDDRPVG
jgi:hypothetical protein